MFSYPWYIILICIYLAEINGFADDLYGNVTPIEIISSVGSLWNFGPGHQDAHELFHVVLSALDVEMQSANRVRNIVYGQKNFFAFKTFTIAEKFIHDFRKVVCPMHCHQVRLSSQI